MKNVQNFTFQANFLFEKLVFVKEMYYKVSVLINKTLAISSTDFTCFKNLKKLYYQKVHFYRMQNFRSVKDL